MELRNNGLLEKHVVDVLKEKKLRIEDALNATKAAMKSGIIEGGGKVLYKLSNALKNIENAEPYQQAREILEMAKKRCDGRVLDDMTVVVSKLYSTY